ncbi:hypothetical protein MED297_17647 [Reinekea sp. MED297]|uniref:Glycoside hydrolase family 19 catalytic domain-containing protein n=1 Tax=Reinekea blandensis MED297 TaxID=314283 RepID=A4BH92_9GAMM|nr:hypothetical protein MED297_17647 [Reinekea sp. MED297] [Reinekea blandensis MED297]
MAGTHVLTVDLCNADGCTRSNPLTFTVENGATEDPTDPSDPTDPPSDDCGIQPKPDGGYTLCQSDLDATEAAITDTELYRLVKDSIQTLNNDAVERVRPSRADNPDNVKRVERLLSQADWNYLFALADPAYNYTRFLQAVAKFKGFCATYDDGRDSDAICRKSLATMFAHFTQETGAHILSSPVDEYRQGLYYLREVGCTEGGSGCGYNAECNPATWQGKTWPCGTQPDGSFKQYFGRGAKQLSYNYNYGPFSEVIYGDVSVLLNHPDRVADSWLNLASAVFFFVTPQAPKPSMLHVIDGTWEPNAHDRSLNIEKGFGATTNIINGGIECGTASGVEKQQSKNRITYYKAHAAYLGVPVPDDEALGCANQGRFEVQGAGGMLIYWDQDWAYHPNNPEGASFACKLVGYQTAYSALIPGNYRQCVEHYFDVDIIEP